jgi:hypothetical protein
MTCVLRFSAEIEYGILRRPTTRCPLPHALPLTISCLRSPLFLRKTPPEHQSFFKVRCGGFNATFFNQFMLHFFLKPSVLQEDGDAIGSVRKLRKNLLVTRASCLFISVLSCLIRLAVASFQLGHRKLRLQIRRCFRGRRAAFRN